MAWKIEFVRSAAKEFEALDRTVQQRIHNYMRERVAANGNPRRLGKPLKGDKATLWAYRVGDYRIVCNIDHSRNVVVILRIGHRRWVYR
ncbi:MAG: type II toxin-antitoxin system RelE/ParE family toxin [Rhodospirillales bacterium]|nr:type II toxin-antitoxin system RelE/ParE family toxin [Rhodospirillales bacterium]